MALVLARITEAASAATLFHSKDGLVMRRVTFLLMILVVAGTSSVRGQQPDAREALRDAALKERGPAREERREGRQDRRDDRQEGREERRDDRRESRSDRD